LQEPALDAETESWFKSLGGEVVVLADPDDTYTRWFREHDASCALQRPDFHLLGRGHDPVALLAELHTYLQGVPQ
jgi:hypothetical protein